MNKKTLSICYTVLLLASSSFSQNVLADEAREGVLIKVKSKEVLNSKEFLDYLAKKKIKLANGLDVQDYVALQLSKSHKAGLCDELEKKFSEISFCYHVGDLPYMIVKMNLVNEAEECDPNKNDIDKRSVISAIKEGSLTDIPERFKNDRDVALVAVKKAGSFLKFFPLFSNDEEIVSQAFISNPDSLKWASDSIKDNKKFILEVIDKNYEYNQQYRRDPGGDSFVEHISTRLQDDEDLFLKLIKTRGLILEGSSKRFISDKKLMTEAANYVPYRALADASAKLKEDKEFVLSVLKSDYLEYKEYAKRNKIDAEKIEWHISDMTEHIFGVLPDKLRNDQDVIKVFKARVSSPFFPIEDRLKPSGKP